MKGRLIFVTILFSLAVILISAGFYFTNQEKPLNGERYLNEESLFNEEKLFIEKGFSAEKGLSSQRVSFEDERSEYIVALNEISRLNINGNYELANEKIAVLQDKLRTAEVQKSGVNAILVLCGVSVLFFVTAFGYIYFAILRPFDKMKGFAARISAGDFDVPLKYERTNYFGEFTWAFDSMRNEITKSRASEKEAIENNKTVIATLSHDIKTPIASIRAYAEGLSANMDSSFEKRERYLSVIIRKCDEVSRLTNDLFLHSVSDLDKLKIVSERVEICSFVEAAIRGEGYPIGEGHPIGEEHPIGEGHPIGEEHSRGEERSDAVSAERGSLVFRPPGFTAFVNMDKNRFTQVCDNIINNARKYAKTDIDVFFTREEESVVLHFRDYGGGIPDENMPFVFDKFYRGTNCGGEQGAGLGLYIVKYIIGEMGGTVALQNHENGLEVKISLPTAYQSQISQSS